MKTSSLYIKFKKVVPLFLIVFLLLSASAQTSDSVSPETIENYSFTLGFYNCSGTYTGELSHILPDGTGRYETNEDSYIQFIYDGSWKDGKLDGDGILYYDNKQYAVVFENNSLKNPLKLLNSDNTYSVINLKNEMPTGDIITYDQTGTITAYDRYYGHNSIQKLRSASVEHTYSDYIQNADSLASSPARFSGTVTEIAQSSDRCFLKISNEKKQEYIACYYNTITKNNLQALVPNVKVGDKLELFGYFVGNMTLSKTLEDEEQLVSTLSDTEFTFPTFELFSGSFADQNAFSKTAASYEYTEMCTYPYDYSGLSVSITGTIQLSKINYQKSTVTFKLVDEDKVYFAAYKFKNRKNIPVQGDTVTVSGTMKGNYKELTAGKYNIYPYVNTTKVKSKK